MKHRLFTTSEKAWDAMQISIAQAKKSVYLQMYIVGDDLNGREFLTKLEDASKRGVRVIALLDTVGSFTLDNDFVRQLRMAGVEVLFCSFFFQRMHRKILIIDETVAFVGGVNVGKSYARWKDLQIEVRGNVVHTVLRSFIRIYKSCGGKRDFENTVPQVGPMKKAKLWFIDHGIGKRREQFREYYTKKLSQAKSSIVIVTPYLLPPRWLIAQLHQAIIRGVSVEIILPEYTDYRIINGVNRSFASFLSSIGSRCYFTRGMNHAKAMVVDGREAVIGSQNLDRLSFNWNIEAGLFFSEPDMVHDLLNVIDEWKKDARVIEKGEAKFRWYDFPVAFLLRLFGFLPLF